MEVHRPKPWHGWREFLKEYLVIVIGVLTALAGEQFVEYLHKQTELREAREALREEIVLNAGRVRFDLAIDQCRARYAEGLAAWARGGPKPAGGNTIGVPDITFSNWDILKSGPLTKMPVKERLKYSRLYDGFQAIRSNQQQQIANGNEISGMAGLESLTLDQAQRLLEVTTRSANTRRNKAQNERELLRRVQSLGISLPEPSADSVKRLEAMCGAIGAPTPKI